MMITTVFLDVDNTLLDFHLCALDSIKRGFDTWGMEYNDNVFTVFNEINDGLWHRIEKGEMTRDELFRIRWQLIFDRLGIDRNGPDFEKMFVANLAESAIPVEGANDLVEYLAGKYDIYVTSNAIHRQQIVRMTKAGMIDYIKDIFTSEVIGFAKPTKEFFDECFRRIPDVKKENVIIIGDSLTADIKGGVDYGIKTCWFNFKGEKYDVRPECDYIVDRLCEIKNIL